MQGASRAYRGEGSWLVVLCLTPTRPCWSPAPLEGSPDSMRSALKGAFRGDPKSILVYLLMPMKLCL